MTPVWPSNCPTCGLPYTPHPYTPHLIGVCSDSFHGCRDCVWYEGRRVAHCATHAVTYKGTALDNQSPAERERGRGRKPYAPPSVLTYTPATGAALQALGIVKVCSCGEQYSLAAWLALRLVGRTSDLELRDCNSCLSSIAVEYQKWGVPCSK